MIKKSALILLSAASAFAMHTAEININDKDLELGAKFDLGQFNSTVEPDTTFVGFTYLNGDEANSEIVTDINGYLEANFLMKREIQNSGVTFGIGVKTNYTKANEYSFMSIPLGLEVGYNLPTAIPVSLGAKVYYAPESLSILDADSFLEYRLDVNIEIIERGSIVLGYRNIDTNFEVASNSSKLNYNSSAYFGFRFAF